MARNVADQTDRLEVAAKARAIKADSPLQVKLELENMRTRLLADIQKFRSDARTFLPPAALTVEHTVLYDGSDMGMAWDGYEVVPAQEGIPLGNGSSVGQNPNPPEAVHSTAVPERIRVPLPSTLGAKLCIQLNLGMLLEAERQLRIGHMNDALHGVRVGVGYKSFLFRNSVRTASSYRKKLRSFDDVHVADAGVLSNARIYTASRMALEALYDRDNTSDLQLLAAQMERYKPIQKADLKANTAIIEHAIRGLHNTHLAWFWSLDVQGDSRDSEWLNESEIKIIFFRARQLLRRASYSVPCGLAAGTCQEVPLGGGSAHCGLGDGSDLSVAHAAGGDMERPWGKRCKWRAEGICCSPACTVAGSA